MKTEITNKLSALAIALSINGLLIGGVAYLFAARTAAAAPIVALVQASAPAANAAEA